MTTVILLAAGAILTVGTGALALCAAAAHADRELEDEPWKGRTMTRPAASVDCRFRDPARMCRVSEPARESPLKSVCRVTAYRFRVSASIKIPKIAD